MRTRGGRSLVVAVGMAAAILVAACAGPASLAVPGPIATPHVPTPADATMVGSGGQAADDGQPVFSFASSLAPGDALASYRATLAASGFTEVGTDGAWRTFTDGFEVLAVRVASDGPPTSIVVRVVSVGGSPSAGDLAGPVASGDVPPRASRPPGQKATQPPAGTDPGADPTQGPASTKKPKPTKSPKPTPTEEAPAPTPSPQAVPTPEPPTPSPSDTPSA